MRTKWDILQERLAKMENDYIVARKAIEGLEETAFIENGDGECAACGTPLHTEADFARHFLIPDERYLNLGECPSKPRKGE